MAISIKPIWLMEEQARVRFKSVLKRASKGAEEHCKDAKDKDGYAPRRIVTQDIAGDD